MIHHRADPKAANESSRARLMPLFVAPWRLIFPPWQALWQYQVSARRVLEACPDAVHQIEIFASLPTLGRENVAQSLDIFRVR